jgi:hypothetical protein
VRFVPVITTCLDPVSLTAVGLRVEIVGTLADALTSEGRPDTPERIRAIAKTIDTELRLEFPSVM